MFYQTQSYERAILWDIPSVRLSFYEFKWNIRTLATVQTSINRDVQQSPAAKGLIKNDNGARIWEVSLKLGSDLQMCLFIGYKESHCEAVQSWFQGQDFQWTKTARVQRIIVKLIELRNIKMIVKLVEICVVQSPAQQYRPLAFQKDKYRFWLKDRVRCTVLLSCHTWLRLEWVSCPLDPTDLEWMLRLTSVLYPHHLNISSNHGDM